MEKTGGKGIGSITKEEREAFKRARKKERAITTKTGKRFTTKGTLREFVEKSRTRRRRL
jgi:hypothetical protein